MSRSCSVLWPDLRLPLSSWIQTLLLSSFPLFGNRDPEPRSDLILTGRSMQQPHRSYSHYSKLTLLCTHACSALHYCTYFSMKDDAVNIEMPVATQIFFPILNIGLEAWTSLTADFVYPTTTFQLANVTSLLSPTGWFFPTFCCPYNWQWAPLLSNQLSDAGWKQTGPSPSLGKQCWWLCTHQCSHLPNGVPFTGPSLVHVAISNSVGAKDLSQWAV